MAYYHQGGHGGAPLLLSLFLLMSAAASGQVLTGALTGFATDPMNARIPGAAVTVIALSTGRQLHKEIALTFKQHSRKGKAMHYERTSTTGYSVTQDLCMR
jgi:hypothetical protein